jgi:hypothetical protein
MRLAIWKNNQPPNAMPPGQNTKESTLFDRSEARSAAAAMLFEEDHHVDPSQGGSAQSLWRATAGGPSESPSQPMRKHYRHVSPAV